jgi:hypothetical protein
MSSKRQVKTATLTATNTFTDAIDLLAGETAVVWCRGTFTATVTPQGYFPGDTSPYDFGADTIAGNGASARAAFKTITAPAAMSLRVGCKSGEFTAGTISVGVAT